jgi:HD-like signal output (HDOD) protein
MNSRIPEAVNTTACGDGLELRIGNAVRNIGIPPRPAILDQIDREMHKDEPDFKWLADVLGADVGIAGSLIKVANSPLFGGAKKVRSVSGALLMLGLTVTVKTVASLALRQMFPHVPSLERFWDSAARTARVSGWLVTRLQGRTGIMVDDAYTLGLFRDCGIPVLMIPFPEYPHILKQANQETTLAFTAIEDHLLSINHAMVGAELAKNWLLPNEIIQAIRHHHDASAIDGELFDLLTEPARRLIAIVQVAEYLIQMTSGLSQTQEWGKLGAACMSQLDISESELVALLEDCREVVASDE